MLSLRTSLHHWRFAPYDRTATDGGLVADRTPFGTLFVRASAAALLAIGGATAGAQAAPHIWPRAGAAAITPSPAPDPTTPARTPPAAVAAPELAERGPDAGLSPDAPLPDVAALDAALRRAYDKKALGSWPGAIVTDVASGQTLFARDAEAPLIPASTTKIVTAAAALTALEPDARLTTRVVDDGTGGIVLVGGGDPTLASRKRSDGLEVALLRDLARTTATALTAAGRTDVRVSYDTSLFSGPTSAPGWKPSYLSDGNVAPVGALMVDAGRVTYDGRARVGDPAAAAAKRFAALLKKRGITVTGRVAAATASSDTAELAAVQSAPIPVLVEHMLATSDNDLAEALARHVDRAAGGPGSFASAAAAITAAATSVGVGGISVADGSGLSRQNHIAPAALAALIRAAAGENARLRPLVTGLPAAGFTGTLVHRFGGSATDDAAGFVRAKTGTLNGVHAMAGTVVTRDGRLVAYALISNWAGTGPAPQAAADGLDALIAVVAQCGCR